VFFFKSDHRFVPKTELQFQSINHQSFLRLYKKYFHFARLKLISTGVVFVMEVDTMKEFFKGLVKRAQYYEQFEIFRNKNIVGEFRDVLIIDISTKSSIVSM
jgi:hypothetical protein